VPRLNSRFAAKTLQGGQRGPSPRPNTSIRACG
jgi:hypothetical protein